MNIGAIGTDISVVHQGKIIFTRSVPIAGNTLTEAIADQLGHELDDAEELKKEHGYIFLEADIADALPMEVKRECRSPSVRHRQTPRRRD